MQESESLLRNSFGLTTYEARAYVVLLRRRMTAKEAAMKANVPMPRVYDTLQRLTAKGFAKQVADGYVAVEPTVALETRMKRFREAFDEQQSSRDRARHKVLRELGPLFDRSGSEPHEPVLLQGLDSIGGAFLEALEGPGDAIILVRKALKAKAAFMGLLGSLAAARKRIKVALPSGTRLTAEDLRFAREHSLLIRYTEPSILDVMVAGERDVILGVPTDTTDEPFAAMAVWVRNREFAKSVRSSLEETWRRGRSSRSGNS